MNLEGACYYRPIMQGKRCTGFVLRQDEWIKFGGTGPFVAQLGLGNVTIRKDPISLQGARREMDAHAIIECNDEPVVQQTRAYLQEKGLQEQKPFQQP